MKYIFLCLPFIIFLCVMPVDMASASGYFPDAAICNIQAIVGNKSRNNINLVILSSNPGDTVVMKPHSQKCITIDECINSKISDCSVSEECKTRNEIYCKELEKQRFVDIDYYGDIALAIGQKIEGSIGIATAMPSPPPGAESRIIIADYSLKDVRIVRSVSYYVVISIGLIMLTIIMAMIIRNLLKRRNFKSKNEQSLRF